MADPPETAWLLPLEQIRDQFHRSVREGRAGLGMDNARIVALERGMIAIRLPVTEAHAGGVKGGVHGGMVAMLVDSAVLWAVLTRCETHHQTRGTAELGISYLRPAAGTFLTCTVHIIKMGRSLAYCDVDVHNDTGAHVAKARVLYAIGERSG